jgi:hypothetical protein
MGSVDVFPLRPNAHWICAAIFLAISWATAAPSVTLEWNANAEPNIAGYKVYYGTNARSYPVVIDVGNRTNHLIPNLLRGLTYYFAVTAYNTDGLESDPSAEVSYALPAIGTLTSSANPALPGQTVIFSFVVVPAPPGGLLLVGAVVFKIDGVANPIDLVDGRATLSTSALSRGFHLVDVEYVDPTDLLGVTNRFQLRQLINTPPVSGPDQTYRFLPNSVKVQIGTLLTNDYDADGDAISLASVAPLSSNGGIVTRRSNWIYYVAPAGFTNHDTFNYTVVDVYGQSVTATVQVTVADPTPAPNGTIIQEGGSNLIRFDATPGLTYRIDYTESVDPPNWQLLGIRTADEFGSFEIIDSSPAGSPPRFYQSVVIN